MNKSTTQVRWESTNEYNTVSVPQEQRGDQQILNFNISHTVISITLEGWSILYVSIISVCFAA